MGSCGPLRDFIMALIQTNETAANEDLHKDKQHNRPCWSFSRCIFWRWQYHTCCRARAGVDAVHCEIPFQRTVCVRVPLCWSCGTPDPAPSLMYVCLQPPPLTHTHTEMRSDSVMNVSAVCPLALHAELCACVCVCVFLTEFGRGHQHVWWGYCQGMGGHRSVLSDWLIGGVVYTVSLCPVKRNRPPADCSLHTRQSSHTNTHTHTIIPHALAGLVTTQTHSCSPTLAGSLPGQKYGVLNKLTDVGHDGGNWLNKLKYYAITYVCTTLKHLKITSDLYFFHQFCFSFKSSGTPKATFFFQIHRTNMF